jgi:hypothetical protein
LFIQSVKKHSNFYSVPATVSGTVDTAVKKKQKPCQQGADIVVIRGRIKLGKGPGCGRQKMLFPWEKEDL